MMKYDNVVIDSDTMVVARGESFHRIYTYDGAARDNACLPRHIVLETGAKAYVTLVVFPGQNENIALTVDLTGPDAEFIVCGAYICGGSEKVRISVDMHHRVPHCNSRQLFKGVAGGASRVDFYGKIIVAQDAQKTEAYQENHNLLLSDDAKVNTKPQLEIYADDVKCSHGATIGRLNEEEQFYMRSRGISLDEAKVLQMISFLSPVLEYIEDEEVKAELGGRLEDAVRTMVLSSRCEE